MESVMTVCTPLRYKCGPAIPILGKEGKKDSSPLRGEGWVRVMALPFLSCTLPLVLPLRVYSLAHRLHNSPGAWVTHLV